MTSSNDMSICWPCPLRSRSISAASMATAAYMPGKDVGEGDADLHRLAIRLAGKMHDAAHRLDQEVVAGTRRVRPGLAESRDRAIDEARIDRPQAVVIEPETA